MNSWINHYRSKIGDLEKLALWAEQYKNAGVAAHCRAAIKLLLDEIEAYQKEPVAKPIVR